jgi:Type IV secretory pathway, VirB3-like protein
MHPLRRLSTNALMASTFPMTGWPVSWLRIGIPRHLRSRGISTRKSRPFCPKRQPLRYLGVERTVFYFVCVAAVGVFNLFESLLAGIVVFIGGFIFGRWVTNADPAMLRILAQSEGFKVRYDAARVEIPLMEVR